MPRSRPDIHPRHAYWVLIGIILLGALSQTTLDRGTSTILLFLFTVVSILLRWRYRIPVPFMILDSLFVGIVSLSYPINALYLPFYLFYFCVHGSPAYLLPSLLVLWAYGSPFSWYLGSLAVITGFLLYFWERQRTALQLEVDTSRQHLHKLEEEEQLLLRDQYSIQQVSRLTERQRIAELLHDNLGHELTAAHLTLKATGTLISQHETEKALILQKQAEQRLGQAMKQLRFAVQHIEPISEMDLRSITDLVHSFPFTVQLSHSGDFGTIPPALRQLLHTSVQEALTNTMKHADSSEVSVSIEITQAIVRATIENNGIKEHVQQPGSGLRYMRKRIEAVNGSLSIQQQGDVFRLIIILPIKE